MYNILCREMLYWYVTVVYYHFSFHRNLSFLLIFSRNWDLLTENFVTFFCQPVFAYQKTSKKLGYVYLYILFIYGFFVGAVM